MHSEPQFKRRKYDVALSFAGEDRVFVEAVAKILRERGVSVFYDKYEEAALWGKDLYTHLSDVYGTQAKFTIAFISAHYARKLWTNHERKSAQARAFEENSEYLLPARFDDTPIPGIPTTIGYVDLRSTAPEQLCALLVEKLALKSGEQNCPAHEVVENDGVHWPVARPEVAMIDIELNDLKLRVAIDPSAYSSLQELQDIIFTHYLSPTVRPYTYGSQWILIGEPFRTRIACPIEWVESAGRSTIDLNPLWASTTTLQGEGIVGGTYWTICAIDSAVRNGVYGVLTKNSELADLLTAEAKAMSMLVRSDRQFYFSPNWRERKDEYRFQLTFRDWLSVGACKIFIDSGSDVPEYVRQVFRRE